MQNTDLTVPDLIQERFDQTYNVSIDQKRRLQIPSKWRVPNGPDEELRLLNWIEPRSRMNCILVLPPGPCVAMARKIGAMPASDPKAEGLRRWFGGQSARVTPDKSGRITIPDNLASMAGLKSIGEAVLVGMVDRFQIWTPESHAIQIQRDQDDMANMFTAL